jgi:hypothetical protein
LKTSRGTSELGDPAKVDAGDAANRHEYHVQLAACSATGDAPRAVHVDDRFGDE